MSNRPEVDTEEFILHRLERAVREQYELHGWATAVSVANPMEILIMLEEEWDGDEVVMNETKPTRIKGTLL